MDSAVREIMLRRQRDERDRLLHQLTRRADLLRALANELTEAEQRERQRVAQVLHDHVQQSLAAVKLRLGMLGSTRPQRQSERLIREIDGLLDSTIDSARTLSVELSPPILKEGSFSAALDWLCGYMKNQLGLEVLLEARLDGTPLSPGTRVFLFEAVRELLFNVTKYAGVDRAYLDVSCESAGMMKAEIRDEGVGFDVAELAVQGTSGFGLFQIRERVDAMGGELFIDSLPGRGARITLVVPIDPGASPDRSAP
jgi:signal transduction histidine kinase